MIRFIDLRASDTQHRFAFWDTSVDKFVTFDGNMAWDSWIDFENDVRCNRPHRDIFEVEKLLHRYNSVTPFWTKEEKPSEVEYAQGAEEFELARRVQTTGFSLEDLKRSVATICERLPSEMYVDHEEIQVRFHYVNDDIYMRCNWKKGT